MADLAQSGFPSLFGAVQHSCIFIARADSSRVIAVPMCEQA